MANLDAPFSFVVFLGMLHYSLWEMPVRGRTVTHNLKYSDPVHVSNDKEKQDITIADLSDASKITVWEENIGKVQAGMSYNFHNFMVREYASTKFLSMAKDGSKIEPISDIGEVKQCKDGNDKEETTL